MFAIIRQTLGWLVSFINIVMSSRSVFVVDCALNK